MSPDDEVIAELRLAQRLGDERPVPGAGWRGELRRRLLAGPRPLTRPRNLRLLVAAYGASGAALLGVAAALGL